MVKERANRERARKIVEETWQQLKHVHLQKREGKAAQLEGWLAGRKEGRYRRNSMHDEKDPDEEKKRNK